MKSRSYNLEDKELYFDVSKFKKYFIRKQKKDRVSISECEESLAQEIACSISKIHSIRFGALEPTDIKEIEALARALEVDVANLLRDKPMSELSDNNIQIDQSEVWTICIPRTITVGDMNNCIAKIDRVLNSMHDNLFFNTELMLVGEFLVLDVEVEDDNYETIGTVEFADFDSENPECYELKYIFTNPADKEYTDKSWSILCDMIAKKILDIFTTEKGVEISE